MKIVNLESFMYSIESFGILRGRLLEFIVYVLPVFEIVLGVGILIPRWRFASCTFTILLLLTFILITVFVAIEGSSVSCGCFGNFAMSDISHLLFRNILILLCVLVIFIKDFFSDYTHKSRVENKNYSKNEN